MRPVRTKLWAIWLVVFIGTACNDETTAIAPNNHSDLFWKISLNHRAVTLTKGGLYDTLQLKVAPLNFAGEVLRQDATITFAAPDTMVLVSSSGLLTARAANIVKWIRVAMTVNGVTLKDSIRVAVSSDSTPLHVKSLSIQPLPGDSSVSGCGVATGNMVRPRLLDEHDEPLTGPPVIFRSADPSIADIHPLTGVVAPSCRDSVVQVMMYAEATIHGRSVWDSSLYTVIPPVLTYVTTKWQKSPTSLDPKAVFSPGVLYTSVGGIIVWVNPGEDSIDVQFENPAAVESVDTVVAGIPPEFIGGNIDAFRSINGNIPPAICLITSPLCIRKARRFSAAGTYTFQSSRYGAYGKIIVVPRIP